MHIRRKRRARKSGEEVHNLYLRHTFRDERGRHRERSLFLGSTNDPEELYRRSARILRARGYTAAEAREIVAAVTSKAERNEHRPIIVRNRPVAWRDPQP